MWSDAKLENWRQVGLPTGRSSGGAWETPPDPSPYERVQSGNGVVRFKRKPVEAVQLPDDSVDDLWR